MANNCESTDFTYMRKRVRDYYPHAMMHPTEGGSMFVVDEKTGKRLGGMYVSAAGAWASALRLCDANY